MFKVCSFIGPVCYKYPDLPEAQLTPGVTVATCRWTYPVVTWLIMPSLALAESNCPGFFFTRN
jgi:hypothetical protein